MPDSHSLAQRISQRVADLLDTAAPVFDAHRAAPPQPEIRFDLTGSAAGQVRWHAERPPLVRFNLDLARTHEADFMRQTVAHEVAHLVTAACHGRTRPHGPEWRAVMAYFGLPDAPRCHSYSIDDNAVRRQNRWTYRCDCDEHKLSTTRHKRAASGRSRYVCRKCGTALHYVAQTSIDPDNSPPSQ